MYIIFITVLNGKEPLSLHNGHSNSIFSENFYITRYFCKISRFIYLYTLSSQKNKKPHAGSVLLIISFILAFCVRSFVMFVYAQNPLFILQFIIVSRDFSTISYRAGTYLRNELRLTNVHCWKSNEIIKATDITNSRVHF